MKAKDVLPTTRKPFTGAIPRKGPGLCFQLFTPGIVKPPLRAEVSPHTPRRHDGRERFTAMKLGTNGNMKYALQLQTTEPQASKLLNRDLESTSPVTSPDIGPNEQEVFQGKRQNGHSHLSQNQPCKNNREDIQGKNTETEFPCRHEPHKHTCKHSGVQTLMNTRMHAMSAQTSKCASDNREMNTQ